jgi:hypothetical protein
MNPYALDPRSFLAAHLPEMLAQLSPESPARWGKMGPQHMVEHVSALFYLSRKDLGMQCITPADKLEKSLQFLWSEKPFRLETSGPGLPAEPAPLRFASLDEAKEKLLESVAGFYAFQEAHPEARLVHPVFGPLDLKGWERFHVKHVTHHFSQFGLMTGPGYAEMLAAAGK